MKFYRVKPSQHHYVKHIYPLIDKGMRRYDCINWLERNNYKIPRSACTFLSISSKQRMVRNTKRQKE